MTKYIEIGKKIIVEGEHWKQIEIICRKKFYEMLGDGLQANNFLYETIDILPNNKFEATIQPIRIEKEGGENGKRVIS